MNNRILVVEDEKEIADFILRGLKEEGYAVEHAASGQEGWNQMQNQSWDLILLDWWLPGEDGIDLLKRFRQTDQTTPVMFLTARDTVVDRVKGLDTGADDYLCKPFAFEELLARVKSLSRRRRQWPGTLLQFENLTVDLETHRVERADVRLDLTSKEYALLTFFMRRAGEVLSRNRIYEQVWEQPYDGVSNTLEVHIKELRRKLENHGDRLIHTVRGQGYMFDSQPLTTS